MKGRTWLVDVVGCVVVLYMAAGEQLIANSEMAEPTLVASTAKGVGCCCCRCMLGMVGCSLQALFASCHALLRP